MNTQRSRDCFVHFFLFPDSASVFFCSIIEKTHTTVSKKYREALKTMKIRITEIAILCFICLALVQCAVNPVTGRQELMLVSEDQEIEMGREFYPNALWGDIGGGGEYKDERLKSYLKDVVMRIHSVSHRPSLPVDFAVQNSSVPNAWAIPGHVVITRGLLAGLDNEAEFAFVLGHEMGHVGARHSARHMTYGVLQQIGLGAAGIALSGTEYADLALGFGAVGSSLLLLKYSRDDELEADRLGVQYLARLGYDPNNAVSAHRNLEKISEEYMRAAGKNPAEQGFMEDLLSTHPRTSVRIEELQQMIALIQPVRVIGDGTARTRYQDMSGPTRKTNRIYLDYYDKAVREYQQGNLSEAESLLTKALGADSRQPGFHAMNGFIMLKKKDYTNAQKFFDAALAIDKEYEPAYRGLGTLRYLREDYSGGIEYLKQGLSLYPQDLNAHYFLGMSYYKMKRYKEATPYLKTVAAGNPKHPEIHGVLGMCYENSGDISSAYNAYTVQVKVAPDNEIGRHAAARAAALKPAVEKKR